LTQRKQRGRAVNQASDHYLLESMPDGVVVVSPEGLIAYVNRRAEKITGYRRGELRGHPVEVLIPQRLRAIHKKHRREYSSRPLPRAMGPAEHDFKVRRKDGTEFSADIALAPLANRIGVVAVIRDITDRRTFEALLEHQALHDPLTNLANRTLFFDRLNQAIRLGKRERRQVALVMLDLDRFKLVNDVFGHAVGDTVLQEFAARLAGRLRGSDTAARLGGDEFAAILPGVSGRSEAERKVRTLLRAFKETITIDGHRFVIGVSAGMALYPEDGGHVDKLMRRADLGLYAAKRGGGGFLSARLSMQRQ
jgi:diguanylate cyclase (GGDEF)-like protein/PAS domain S-box-containing protein